MKRLYLGMDLHKNFSYFTAMDQKGHIQAQKRVENIKEQMQLFLDGYDPSETEVAVEATWNWYWVYELLEAQGFGVHLVHAEKAKAIASAKVKTDRVDSEILANLLKMDYLPEAHIASHAARHRRERLRYRQFLVRIRTMLKHNVHTILAKTGTRSPYKCLFTKQAKEWLEGLNFDECYLLNLKQTLRLIEVLNSSIKEVEKWLLQETQKDKRIELLKSLPGVGDLTAMLLVSEIDTIDRFKRWKSFVSYTGLSPSLHSSGTVHRTGSITKKGNKWIRWALIESAQHATFNRSPFHSFYNRVKRKKGGGKAITAVASKLAKLVYQTLRQEKPFDKNKYLISSKHSSIYQRKEPGGVMVAA